MAKTWKDLPDKSTPINAEALNILQKGVEDFNEINVVTSGSITLSSPWVDVGLTQSLKKRNGIVQLFIQISGGDPWASPSVLLTVPAGFKPMFATCNYAMVIDFDAKISILYDDITDDFMIMGIGSKPDGWDSNSQAIVSMTYLCEI